MKGSGIEIGKGALREYSAEFGLQAGMILRVHPREEAASDDLIDGISKDSLHRLTDKQDTSAPINDREYVTRIREEAGMLAPARLGCTISRLGPTIGKGRGGQAAVPRLSR